MNSERERRPRVDRPLSLTAVQGSSVPGNRKQSTQRRRSVVCPPPSVSPLAPVLYSTTSLLPTGSLIGRSKTRITMSREAGKPVMLARRIRTNQTSQGLGRNHSCQTHNSRGLWHMGRLQGMQRPPWGNSRKPAAVLTRRPLPRSVRPGSAEQRTARALPTTFQAEQLEPLLQRGNFNVYAARLTLRALEPPALRRPRRRIYTGPRNNSSERP